MELCISIGNRQLMLLLAVIIGVSAVGLVVGYGGSNPQVVGHSWGEMECSNIFCVNANGLGVGTTDPGTSKLKVAGMIESSSGGFKFPDGTTQATGGSSLKFLSSPVNKISWTAATDWTDVDISANTGTNTAKAALIAVDLQYTGANTQMLAKFRKNGMSETSILPRLRCNVATSYDGAPSTRCGAAEMFIVELDGSEIFEAKLETVGGSPSSISFNIDLIGYFV